MTNRELPPDPDGLNDARAEWARFTVRSFRNVSGIIDSRDLVADLLTALRHLCDRTGTDFMAELERANASYAADTRDE